MTRGSGEERRAKLLDEAIRSFGANGYDGTSLDGVAAAAGVRKQTLLYYFPSKEDLFESCVETLSRTLGAALERVLESRELGWQRVESIIRGLFDLAAEQPELLVFAREAARRSPEIVQRVADDLEPLRKRAIRFLEHEMEEGRFRTQDPRLLLFTLYTAIVGSLTEAGVLRAMAGRASGRTALKKREEELVRFVRRALEV